MELSCLRHTALASRHLTNWYQKIFDDYQKRELGLKSLCTQLRARASEIDVFLSSPSDVLKLDQIIRKRENSSTNMDLTAAKSVFNVTIFIVKCSRLFRIFRV